MVCFYKPCSELTECGVFMPYAVPAVAPSGAFRVESPANKALGVFVFVPACVVKTDHCLHCAAQLHSSLQKTFTSSRSGEWDWAETLLKEPF